MRDLSISSRLMRLNAEQEAREEAADNEFREYLLSQGFSYIRQLEGGEYVGILKLMFTTSVCCDITRGRTHRYRWCFKDPKEAQHFVMTLVDYDEVPTVRTSLVGHRYLDSPLLREKDELGLDKW